MVAYDEQMKSIFLWTKKHAWIIVISFLFGWFGSQAKTEIDLELDCKYAKAVRIGSTAFKCERII